MPVPHPFIFCNSYMPAAPHTHFWKLALLLAGIATLFSSCGEDPEVRSYTAANHYEGPVVSWVMPEQWGENPGMSGMMAGSFHIKTPLGPRGRIGVMPFRESVETTQIVNMFARELGHPDYNESSVQPLVAHKKLGDRSFEVIRLEDMSGEEGPQKPPCSHFTGIMHRLGYFPLSQTGYWSIRNWKTFTVFYNPPPCGQARLPFGQLPPACPLPNLQVPGINQPGKHRNIGNASLPPKCVWATMR